jgi:antitoxin (DNA-binding transcriptional repressor) of toxin-antitoxin stability system
MKAIQIKALRDGLSRYLRMVREGETVWVLDRDEVIAEMHRPTQPMSGRISRWEAFLNEQERIGGIVRAKPGPALSLGKLWGMMHAHVPVDLQKFLDEVKSD